MIEISPLRPEDRAGWQPSVIGIAHYTFQASIWFDDVCYLADLFVDEAVRGQRAARKLLEAVAAAARARGLYDKVARHVGFIRCDYPMG